MVVELLVDYLLADAENFQSSKHSWAISSGGEHYLDTVGVTSSNLVSPTKNDKTEEDFLLGLFLLLNRFAGNVAAGMDPVPHPDSIGSRPKHNIWV